MIFWIHKFFLYLATVFFVITYSQVLYAQGESYSKHVVKINAVEVKGRKITGRWTGTGFLLNDQGYVATNSHVVDGSTALFVLRDGQRMAASQGFDYSNKFEGANVEKDFWNSNDLDLAVIKIKPEYLNQLNLSPVVLTNITPDQGDKVSAQGYPGLADASAIKTRDITASSTFTSGEVARIIKDGKWSRSNQNLQQLIHTAAISGGNSGGPAFDECGRVIGVNTAGPQEAAKVYQKGKRIALDVMVANNSYSIASDIKELIKVLDSQNITYNLDSSICLSKEEKFEKNLKLGLYAGAVAFVLFALMLIYVLRKSSTVQASASQTGDRVSEIPQRPSPIPRDNNSVTTKGAGNFILDGYGNAGGGLRLIIGEDELQRGEVGIGRTPDNDYHINDDSVSRQHCLLHLSAGNVYIRDLGSTNGTYINNVKLTANENKLINSGDDLKLGSVSFKVIAD